MNANELLRRYVFDRSEAAFAELVRQHIDLVYSAALRQVGGDAGTAEEVVQSVFTDLARKAPALLRHTSLTGWLYTSTRYRSAKMRRAEQCRRDHEREAHQMNELLRTTDADSHWQELRPLLDDAMHDLGATDREAILLRYFEHLSLAEVGTRLGLKENAARMRVDRAVDRLRTSFRKRGVTSTVTALATLLAKGSIGAAPSGLARQVSGAAFGAAAVIGGLGWSLLRLTGLIKGHALVVAGGVALATALIIAPHMLTKLRASMPATSVSGQMAKPVALVAGSSNPEIADPSGQASANAASSNDSLKLRIVENKTGKPIAGAKIEVLIGERDAISRQLIPTKMATDSFGACEFSVPRETTGVLLIRSRTDGFVDTTAAWNARAGNIPSEYTMRLDEAVPIGGMVVDAEGRSVSGAEVKVQISDDEDWDRRKLPQISYQAGETTLTDAEGHWRIVRFAKKSISEILFQVVHPDFIADTPCVTRSDEIERQRLAGTYTYKLDHGITLSGIVVGPEGEPVPGVKLSLNSVLRERETTNQSDGTFVLFGCKPGAGQLNAEASGFAHATVILDLTNPAAPLRLELRRGNLLRLRVVDTNGIPIPNATARLQFNPATVGSANGAPISREPFERRTDADGRIVWDSAPEGRLLFGARAAGYASAMNISVRADGEEHSITLHATRKISGSVRDAATGEPLSRFRIVTGALWPPGLSTATNLHWAENRDFKDGEFHYDDERASVGLRLKFEADGYASSVTRLIGWDEGEVSFNITLHPAAPTTVTVILPDGRTATNASIAFELPGEFLSWRPGGFGPRAPKDRNMPLTDDVGHFVLPPDETITNVVAVCPDGYAEATPAMLAADPNMRLQPWGRIEGTFLSGGKPAVGRELTLGWSGGSGMTIYNFDVETDAEGHFLFPKVPPKRVTLFQKETRNSHPDYQRVRIAPVAVRLGETTVVSPQFYTVTARLNLPPAVGSSTNWYVSAAASHKPRGDGAWLSATFDKSNDGTWMAEDLTSGTYALYATDAEPGRAGVPPKVHQTLKASFTVPADPPSGLLDLGEIELQPAK